MQTLSTNENDNSIFKPDADSVDIEQTYPISYNSFVYLDSTIFSVTGSTGTYRYDFINAYGSEWDASFTGYHFEVTHKSYSLSNYSKNCTITLTGTPVDSQGIGLAIVLHASHTFSAN